MRLIALFWAASVALLMSPIALHAQTPSVTVSADTLRIPEGDSLSYTITLSVAAAVPVHVDVVSSDPVYTSPFPENFGLLQGVTSKTIWVRVLHDQDQNDEVDSLTHSISGGIYDGVSVPTVVVLVTDDETVDPPTDVTITAESAGSATISWKHPGDATITHWQVLKEVSRTGVGSWEDIPGSDKDTRMHTVSGLNDATEYRLGVRAVNPDGMSASDWVIRNIPLPAKPTGLTAVPGHGHVELTWDDPDNVTITRWDISISGDRTSGENWQPITGSDSSTTSHTVRQLLNGRTYAFKVRAANRRGLGPGSDSVTAMPIGVPAAPENITTECQDGQTACDGYVEYQWSSILDSTVTHWEFQQTGEIRQGNTARVDTVNASDWATIPGSGVGTTSHRVTGLTNFTRYYFRVRAVNRIAFGTPTARWVRGYPFPPVPVKPTGFSAEATGPKQVRLSWSDPENASIFGWQYQQKEGSGSYGRWITINPSSATTTSHTVDSVATLSDGSKSYLKSGTTYTFRIRASSGSGSGPPSDPKTVTTPGPGVVVSVTELEVPEGGSGTYTIKLNSEPTDDVTVKVRGMSGDVSVADTALTFTTQNYDTAQTVTVRAAHDPDVASDPAVTLTHVAEGGGYGSVTIASVVVTVTEDDTPGVTVSETALTVPEGDSASYTVRLDAEPSNTVTVKVRGMSGDVTVADTALTFTAQNYGTAKTVWVRAAADPDAASDPAVTLMHVASGGGYGSVTIASVVVTVTEDDTPGVMVSETALTVPEGDSASYTVKLDTEPSNTVTVKVRGMSGDVTVADTALTFTAQNYGAAQTVTVRAAEDPDADSDPAVTLTHHASGGDYGSVTIGSVEVTVTEDDTIGATVSVTELDVTEGDSATYTIKLDALPTGNVTVKVRGMSGDVTVADTALTFTPGDFGMAQTVTVRAAEDPDADADAMVTLTHHASGGGYGAVTIAGVVVTVTEDDTPGVMVSETVLTVPEGDSASYTVKLNTEPSNTVTLKVRGMSGDVTVSDTALTFTAQNYGAAQTVWVRAAHDSDAVTDATVSLKHHAEGGGYASVTIDSVVVTVTEDDTPGVMVSETALAVDEGDSASYTVKLNTEPSNTVTLKVRGMTGDVTVSDTALTFTAQNYGAAQTVWVRAAHDSDAVTDATVSLKHHAEGGGYASVTIDSVVVTVTEDDTPGVMVSETALTVDEGDSVSYTVKLNTEPSNTVTVKVRGMSGDVTVSDTALTFTAQNYGAAQTVWVRAAHDPDAASDPAVSLKHHAEGGEYASVTIDSVVVTVTEDDTPGVTVSAPLLAVDEGDSASYTVKLDTEPSNTVTVKVRGMTGDVTVSDTALTFTAQNYGAAQTVWVRAAHDPDANADPAVTLTHHASGGDYASVPVAEVAVSVIEDDTVGATVSVTDLNVTEGSSATYTIKLNALPSGDVTVKIRGFVGTDVSVADTALTFTTVNYDTAQTVTVRAAHDPDGIEGAPVTLTHHASGGGYGSVSISGVRVQVKEDDAVGVTISETKLTVLEGDSASYTIKLNTKPVQNRHPQLTSASRQRNANVTIRVDGASGDVTVSPASLTFTDSNWDTAQTVWVHAAHDPDGDADPTVTLRHRANGAHYGFSHTIGSPWATRDSVVISDVAVTVTEDDIPGATISETELEVAEGGSATYTIKLNTAPTDDVTVKIRGASGDVSVSDTSLTFTTQNFDTAQTVTVSAAEDNDAIVEADVALTHHASGGGYGSVDMDSVVVSVTENDTAGATVSVTELEVGEGDSATYTIKLNAEPSGDVTVKIRGFGSSDVSLADTALTFTAGNYGTAQTVTVRAAEDNDAITDAGVALTHHASGGGYGGVSIAGVAVSVTENDTAGVTVSVIELDVTEGDSATYTIKLDSEPSGDVTVKIRGFGGSDVSLADTALTFTAQDYGTAQTVTVRAAEDNDAVADGNVMLSHVASGGGYGGVSIGSVIVSVQENDVAGGTLSVDTLEVTEGGSGTYTIKLNTEPTDTVEVVVRGASGDVSVVDTLLKFTTGNYGTAQTVTVRAAEDNDALKDPDVALTHHYSGGGYTGVAIDTVVVSVTENEVLSATVRAGGDTFNCAAMNFAGCVATLDVAEGDSADYKIKLNAEPSGNVTVKVRGASGGVSVSDTSLTFTTANYDTEQTVWVWAAEDSDADGENAMLTHHPTGGGYSGVTLDSIWVEVEDNDTVGVVVSVSELEVVEGDSASYTIKLKTLPVDTVTVYVELLDEPGDVSVSASALKFTTSNWNEAQTVWVRAAEDGDGVTDDPVTLSHSAGTASFRDPYGKVEIDSVVVSVTENDTIGATVSVTDLNVTEGGSATYTIKLDAEPSGDVTVKIRGTSGDVSVTDTALTFTAQNYGTAQTVTVNAAEDDDAITDADVTLTHHASGGGYGSVKIDSVVVSVTENDVAGATVSVTELEVAEGGSGTYTVKLNTEPSGDVTVKIRGASGDVSVTDTALTFTTQNYDTAQTVTVNAAEDSDAAADPAVTLTHHASGGGYGSVTIASVAVTVTENDTVGATVSESALTVGEGDSASYTVKLNTEPTGNVTVKIRGMSGDVTVADTSLTFTSTNYDTAQTVWVRAGQDPDAVTDPTVTLTHHASGGGYGSASIGSVVVTVTEDDTPGVTVSVTELEVAEGASGTYTIKLNAEPSDTVTVKIRGASGDVTVADTALKFTTGNYGTVQTVTVNAAEDDDAVADAAVTLTHHASGGGYGSVTIGSVTVTVTENDTVGATVSESALTVGEGDSASYTVRLNTEPTGSVTVKVRGMSGDVTVADTSLTFTTTNYDTAQTVWVRAAEDPDAVTDATVTLTHHASGGGYASAEIDSVVVTVTEKDEPGVTVSLNALTVTEGDSASYTVKLNTPPSVDVTVKVEGASGDVTVADTLLTFTQTDYGTAQTVWVRAAHDADAIADPNVRLSHASSGGEYEAIEIGTVLVTVEEDDTVGVTSSRGTLTVTEGDSASYTVKLDTEPSGNVTVKVRGMSGDVTVADTALTFTTANYDTAQTVWVHAGDDPDAATDPTVTLTHHASGGGYGSASVDSVVVSVTEDDVPGATVSVTELEVVEGASGTYTVKLNTAPSDTVTVKIRGTSGDVSVADTALKFTTGNYGTAQTVTVNAAEDDDAVADAAVTLTHHASGGGYGSVTIGSVTVTVTENDTVGATVSESALTVVEGGSGTYTIRLNTEPPGNVTVKVRGASGDVTVADTSLTFTTGNYGTAQTVTVNAAEDADAATDATVTLTHHASGGGYASADIASVVVTVTENDTAGVTVSQSALTVVEGASGTYTVKLNTEPSGNVTVKVRGASGDVTVADTALTFTTGNYGTAQTVRVRAAEDPDANADAAVTLTHHASGGGYGSVSIGSVVVTVTENDTIGATVSVTDLEVLEGGSATYTIKLDAQPSGNVTVKVRGASGDVTVADTSLTFTQGNFASAQTVTVNAADDNDAITDDDVTLTHHASGGGYGSVSIDSVVVSVTENDVAGATVSVANLAVPEGDSSSYTVRLNAEPTGNVTLKVRGASGDVSVADTSLTFTTANYDTAQTVWVRAAEDDDAVADAAATLTHHASGGGYGSVTIRSVVVTVTENDSVAMTRPDPPQALRGLSRDGAVVLSWTVGGDGGAALTGHEYRMRVGESGDWGEWTEIGSSGAGGANVAGYTVTGLVNGTAYMFAVRAVNRVGASDASDAVTVTPEPTVTVPPALELRGEPGDGAAVLSWIALGDGGSAITGHQYRMRGSGGWGEWTAIESSAAGEANEYGYTVTGLVNDSVYTFVVRAVNEVGAGPESNAVAVTPVRKVTVPPAPGGLRVEPGDASVTLFWTVGDDGGSAITMHQYRIREGGTGAWGPWTDIVWSAAADGVNVLSHSADSYSFAVTGLVNGTAYTFEVRVVNEVGPGPASNAVTVTPTSGATVPEAPGELRGEPRDRAAMLSWTVGGNGGSAITAHHYRMRMGGGADWGAWTEIESSGAGGANAAGYTVTGLVNDSTYTFEVRAVNEVGPGPESNAVDVTPEATVTVPEAPGELRGEPGDGLAVLSWTVGGDGGSAITAHHYRMRMGGSADWGAWTEIESSGAGGANAAGYTVTGLVNDSTYTFEVRAVNEVGAGPASNAVAVTPEAAVTVPEAPGALQGEPGDGLAVLSWTVGGDGGSAITAHHYRMRMGGGADWGAWTEIESSGAGGANAAGYTVTGLVNDSTYTFEVRAVNEVGPGPESNAVAVTPEAAVTVPDAPEELRGEAGDGLAVLSWTVGGDGGSAITAHHYRMRMAGSTDWGMWTDIESSGAGEANAAGYTVTGLVNDSTYTFEVRAVNEVGPGPESNAVNVTPEAAVTVPEAPGDLRGEAGDGLAVLSWTVSGDGGSAITAHQYRMRMGASADWGLWADVPSSGAGGANAAGYTVTGLVNGTAYTFEVRAVNGVGPGPASNAVAVTPEAEVTVSEAEMSESLAALGRGYLSSARMTLSRWLEGPGRGSTQVTVRGRQLPLGVTEAVNEGRSSISGWWTGLLSQAAGAARVSGGGHGHAVGVGVLGAGAGGSGGGVNLGLPGLGLGSGGGIEQSSFSLALGGRQTADEGSGTWAVWGQGDVQNFEGVGASRYDGRLTTAWLGVDRRVNAGWVLGLAATRSVGESGWQSGGKAGGVETTLTAAHPYARWSNGSTTVWAMMGVGRGEAEAMAEGRESETRPLSLAMGLVDFRQRLVSGGFGLDLRGDAAWMGLETDAYTGMGSGLSVPIHQGRIGMEATGVVGSSGWRLTPFGGVSARWDGGSGQTGFGLELAGGLRVAGSGLEVDAQGRALVLHEASGYREHGFGVSVRYGSGSEGQGLNLSVAPRWGSSARDSGMLWQEQLRRMRPGAEGGVNRSGLDARVGYGWRLSGGQLVSPYGSYGMSGHGGRMQVGAQVAGFGGGVGDRLRLGVLAERAPGLGGGHDHRFGLQGFIGFGGSSR